MIKHILKQIVATTLAAVLCLSLTACGTDNYQKAEELYAAGDYAGALKLYTTLGDREDIKEKIAHCEREIGMAEYADNAFLADIEASVLERISSNADGELTTEELKNVVNAELTRLEKYSNEVFYNSDLADIADKYIKGLHSQMEYFDVFYLCEQQIVWYTGIVLRCEALNELYKNYDFMTDNKEFIDAYITSLEEKQEFLKKCKAVDADIIAQSETEDFGWFIDEEQKVLYSTMKNNTEYTLDLIFRVSLLDENEVVYESYSTKAENIEPGKEYTVGVPVSDVDRLSVYEWDYYLVAPAE